MSPGAGPQSPGRLCRSHGHSEISLRELSCFAPFLCSVSAGRSRAGEALPERPSLPLMCRKKHFERDLQYRPEPMASTAAHPTLYARCIRDEFILAGVGVGRAEVILRVQVCTCSLQPLPGSSSSWRGGACPGTELLPRTGSSARQGGSSPPEPEE